MPRGERAVLEQLLFDGMREMGLDPSREGVSKLIPYLEMMLDRNRSLNLTAVKDPDNAVRLHLLDALSLFQALQLSGRRVLDVGTGGGMPGVALALYEPSARVTMLDATAKKLSFIREACERLCIHAGVCQRACGRLRTNRGARRIRRRDGARCRGAPHSCVSFVSPWCVRAVALWRNKGDAEKKLLHHSAR